MKATPYYLNHARKKHPEVTEADILHVLGNRLRTLEQTDGRYRVFAASRGYGTAPSESF